MQVQPVYSLWFPERPPKGRFDLLAGALDAGAMRQWGHHATAFVGRRHFDDADLIERRFVIPALE